ncbi:Non-specific serine/threonine protein kinase [Bertholletia excelsa]
MSVGFFLLLSLSFALVVFIHGQSQTGFISIDCGAPENFNYVDLDTGISYTSDESHIGTGINRNISAEPNGGKGSLNLIRASFLYGDYDGQNKAPEFDLYLDVNLWLSVKFKNASDIVTSEIINVAVSDTIYICLINIGLGTPFISGLELRPLHGSVYNIESGTSASLLLFRRWDIGYRNGSGRYKDDIYDRIWSSYSSSSWKSISTSSAVDTSGNGYRAPLEVMGTASLPLNDGQPLELYWTTTNADSHFYVYLYFAEIERLTRNQSREFNISWNGTPLFGPLSARFLYAATVSNLRPLTGQDHWISIYRTGKSTLPPILNAVEIFTVRQVDELPTYIKDVDAITDFKLTYQVNKNWVGDPCRPKNYSWEGLRCSYNGSNAPRIISLNLTSSRLSGGINPSIANLSSLETLDLSNNSLSGQVPDFVGMLPFLKFFVDSQNLCTSNSCKKHKKKKIIVPIAASLSSALVLLIILIIAWRIRRKGIAASSEGKSLEPKKSRFTYSEIVSITNNFHTTLGKGGFGTVYLGGMEDGNDVAVKMLSPASSQGHKEFRTEVELLMRVHHRNLASFVGYCDDKNNLALIYEYMANGNLKDYISDGRVHNLNWEMRLRIAIDAAQGLEYLHHGCKPPIIHRDVKSANILLNESLDAKIADFGLSIAIPSDGLSHVSTTVMGTRGYLDPEYCILQKLNEKSDVYSFGIVLLELITGQPAIIKFEHHVHIVEWVRPMLERGEIKAITDQRLQGDYDMNSVWRAVEAAMACTTHTSMQRPTMNFVLTELKECMVMELARVRVIRPTEVNHMIYAASNYSSEVFSGDIGSMTGPIAR